MYRKLASTNTTKSFDHSSNIPLPNAIVTRCDNCLRLRLNESHPLNLTFYALNLIVNALLDTGTQRMHMVRSGAISGFEALITEYGANPISLLSSVGFSYSQLRDPNTYISYSKMAELMEIAATACNQPLLGLKLAGRQNTSIFGDLPITLAQFPTIAAVLNNINRHLYIHARGVNIFTVSKDDFIQVIFAFDINSPKGIKQVQQLSVGHLVNLLAEFLSLKSSDFRLLLQQPPPIDYHNDNEVLSKNYKKVKFDSDVNGIVIPAGLLKQSPQQNQSEVTRLIWNNMNSLESQYPKSFQDQIKGIINQLLPSGECNIERVAATLDLRPRGLQKRLEKENQNYRNILEETRQNIAEQHLRDYAMSITELALHLGYAEVSIFSRNFKLWTGMSPRMWQQKNSPYKATDS